LFLLFCCLSVFFIEIAVSRLSFLLLFSHRSVILILSFLTLLILVLHSITIDLFLGQPLKIFISLCDLYKFMMFLIQLFFCLFYLFFHVRVQLFCQQHVLTFYLFLGGGWCKLQYFQGVAYLAERESSSYH